MFIIFFCNVWSWNSGFCALPFYSPLAFTDRLCSDKIACKAYNFVITPFHKRNRVIRNLAHRSSRLLLQSYGVCNRCIAQRKTVFSSRSRCFNTAFLQLSKKLVAVEKVVKKNCGFRAFPR